MKYGWDLYAPDAKTGDNPNPPHKPAREERSLIDKAFGVLSEGRLKNGITIRSDWDATGTSLHASHNHASHDHASHNHASRNRASRNRASRNRANPSHDATTLE